ncbi:HlyD family secretion protein [Isoptericola sp. 4D.3]|jgi:multidrug resistance efflux pump|uniref:HlyD family secretion protein n=1 Tax=Isoptericola peretonis TaxID=2918523 RepID=A0ABT0J738_9MICO|nr:HlyD family secretion protein [Isoptericola sp. 4D.3]
MTWTARLRLLVGLLAVVLLCTALTLVMNRRTGQATSSTATISAETLAVGTDYAGTVTEALVEVGDEVRAGDPLLVLRSLTLQHDLAVGLVSEDASAYEVTDDGTMTVVAPADGVVTDVAVGQGGFARAGEVLASVERHGSMFVDARLVLDPADFARVRDGAPVTVVLPNQAELDGTVASVAVQNTSNQAEATVRVRSDGLVRGGEHGLVMSGTPVTAVIELHDDGPLAGVDASFDAFLRKVGL